MCWNCNQKGRFQNQCSKPVASKDKKVNMAARDSGDTLVCCVENMVGDRIMDYGASFHATYCIEELERFKLRSGKVRLADDKTLDIASIGDVVLKTSFGTSWTLKDVRYTLGLKRRLISVGWLDEEGYHEAEEAFLHNVRVDKETAEDGATGVAFRVAKRLTRTFRAESTGLRAEAPKMLWADSVSTAYLIYRIPYISIGLRIPEEEWSVTDSSSLMKPIHKSQVVLVDITKNLAENDSIVAKHRLSSKITQSPGGSSNTSERSKNSESFEDSGRSDKEYSKDGASFMEGGSETPQITSMKEGITKIVDVQGSDMTEFNKPKW
ncbi:hypothetical protein Tco_1437232 [Tanacetum coccineum]